MYSPRSVSTTSMPAPSSAAGSPISSPTIDLPRVMVFAFASRQILSTISRACAASFAQWTTPPARVTAAS